MTDRTYESVLADIKQNPAHHIHVDLNDLNRCCLIDGCIDLALIDAHAEYAPLGRNGGQACDVLSGPCACGAWH